MSASRSDYPRLALPFTILPDGERVHLVHGEDVRYTLTLGRLAERAAALLRRCTGEETTESLLTGAPPEEQAALRKLIERALGERILAAGPVEAAHRAETYTLDVQGSGPLAVRLGGDASGGAGPSLSVFCQETLDYHALLEFNRVRIRAGDRPWLWATTGPASRGFVSPVILPRAGPCLACLWSHFRRLSPAAPLYDVLVRHGTAGGQFAPVDFPERAAEVLAHIVRWKVEQLSLARPPLSVYRLHVLEVDTMEVSMHRVLVDPTCQECGDATVV